MGSFSRFDTIEHYEQVEVAVRTFVATRYRPEEHDPLWRHLPDDVIDSDRQPLPQGLPPPERRFDHELIIGCLTAGVRASVQGR